MCNQSRTTLEETEDGVIKISIDPNDVWDMLSDDTKERLLEDMGYWHIVRQNLKHELGRGVSSDSFMPSTQRLREAICTDPEFVPEIVVACVKQLLEDKASAIQKEREAVATFWKLYNACKGLYATGNTPEWLRGAQTNYDLNKNDDYMRFSTNDVKAEVLQAFFESIAK